MPGGYVQSEYKRNSSAVFLKLAPEIVDEALVLQRVAMLRARGFDAEIFEVALAHPGVTVCVTPNLLRRRRRRRPDASTSKFGAVMNTVDEAQRVF